MYHYLPTAAPVPQPKPSRPGSPQLIRGDKPPVTSQIEPPNDLSPNRLHMTIENKRLESLIQPPYSGLNRYIRLYCRQLMPTDKLLIRSVTTETNLRDPQFTDIAIDFFALTRSNRWVVFDPVDWRIGIDTIDDEDLEEYR